MLTAQSYITAWSAYAVATLLALVLLNGWWRNFAASPGRLAVLGLLAGLALAPAYPDASGEIWAPALFVAAFTLLIDGLEAARQPLKSLVAGAGLGVVVGLLMGALARFVGGNKADA